MSAPPLGAVDLHRLVLLYLSVAYETDENFDPAEHDTLLRILRRWMPDVTVAEVDGVIDTALKALRGGMTEDLESLARAVGANLSPEHRLQVLTNLGQIARADGYLSLSEARVIRRVRTVFEATDV